MHPTTPAGRGEREENEIRIRHCHRCADAPTKTTQIKSALKKEENQDFILFKICMYSDLVTDQWRKRVKKVWRNLRRQVSPHEFRVKICNNAI